MVQVLPYVPSPLEQLTPHLAQFGANIGEGLARRAVNKQDQAAFKEFETADTDIAKFSALSKLSTERLKAVTPLYSSFMKTQAKSQELAQKQAVESAEKQEAQRGISQGFERADELIPYGGTGGKQAILGHIPYTEASGKREELDSLGLWLADAVYTKFNKGTLAKVKWDDLKTKFALNSGLSDVENHARSNAMKTIMGLPSNISEDKFEQVVKKQEKEIAAIDKAEKQKGHVILNKESKNLVTVRAPDGSEYQMTPQQAKEAVAKGGGELVQ